jgi:UDP-glucose 4-epimerase
MARILITGGAGFIGSHVADAYLGRGDQVLIVDDLSHGRSENIPSGAEFMELDIRDQAVADLIVDWRPDVISHHAAQMDVRLSVADPRFDASVNVDGLLNLLEAVRKVGVRRFVYVSSGGVVYGEPDVRPTPETAAKLPESPYGVTKLTGEHYLYYYHRVHGLDYVALRYANVYGPRQDPHGEAGVVAIFSTRLLAGSPLTVFGDGEQTRDYVYVGDVVAANLLVAEADLPAAHSLDERAFNVGTGVETSVNELAQGLIRASGTDVQVEHAPARAGELRHSSLDTARLRALGWTPAVKMAEGLAETYRWIANEVASK